MNDLNRVAADDNNRGRGGLVLSGNCLVGLQLRGQSLYLLAQSVDTLLCVCVCRQQNTRHINFVLLHVRRNTERSNQLFFSANSPYNVQSPRNGSSPLE